MFGKILTIFILLAVICCVLWSIPEPTNDNIPAGIYAPFITSNNVALQINITDVHIDNAKHIVVLWIRADQNYDFISESGAIGRTTFTNIMLDCETGYTTILEQKTFSSTMELKADITQNINLKKPESIVEMGAVLGVCKLTTSKPSMSKEINRSKVPT